MAISSINLAMSASSYGAYNQKLTATTKTELDKLGIIYDPNITEAEGKALIQKANLKEAQNNNKSSLFGNKQQTSDLFEKAKELAKKLGIEVEESTQFNQLLAIIEATLEDRIEVNKGNMNELAKLRSLSQDLAFIQAMSTGSTGLNSTNRALEMSLEMLSLYNQNFLNK